MSFPSSTADAAAPVPAPGRLPAWKRGARLLLSLGLVLASVALAAWLTLHWGILPRIDQWRPALEQQASVALGQPVRIGAVRVRSHGWVPTFELDDVRVLDREGRLALQLGQLRAALAPQSLLALELRFSQLHVDGVQLDVRRDAAGRIRVAGLDAETDSLASSDDGRAADWLFSQHEIVVRHGSVRWTDERRAAPPLELRDVDIVLRNSLRRHQMRLDATPPATWGQRFTAIGQFRQGLLARRGDWRRWAGTVYADLPAFGVSELRQYVYLPFELDQGWGSARAWLDIDRGAWRELTADVALTDVSARLATHLAPLAIADLHTRVTAERSPEGVQLAARQLAFATGDGVVWPAGDLALEWQQAQPMDSGAGPAASAPAAPVTGGRLRADVLDLGVLGGIAARLPLGRAVEGVLASLAPAGRVNALELRWSGSPDAPKDYRAKGQVQRLALAPQAAASAGHIGRPGLEGADIDFEMSDNGGQAKVSMKDGAVLFPGVFEDPKIPLAQFEARVEWRVQRQPSSPRPAIELRVSDGRFANADAQGDLRALWRTGTGAEAFGPGGYLPGYLDLSGRLVRARADRVAAYLPMGIPGTVRHYVGRAVRGGRVDNGNFAVKGDAALFPFHNGREGTFRIAGQLHDAAFDYLPSVPPGQAEPAWQSPWPGFTQVSGELLFERASMRLDRMRARLWDVQLNDVQARIDNFLEPLLQVDGQGRGPMSDLLRFVDVSPVGQWVGGGLQPLSATGAGDLKLALGIPLREVVRSTVKGSIALAGNDVRIRPDMPVLAGARGRVDFSERGFQVVGATARALGGEVSVDGGTQADGSLRFLAQGVASAEGLERAVEFAPLPAVAKSLKGQAAWRAQLNIQQGIPELTVTSDLVGLASDWPAPLHKAAASNWPLRWQTQGVAGTGRPGQGPLRDRLQIDLGPVLQLRLLREAGPDGMRVLGGSAGIGEPAPTSTTPGTLLAAVRLARLDTDAWGRAMTRWPDGAVNVPTSARWQVSAHVQELVGLSRRLSDATIDLQRATSGPDVTWQAQVMADQAAGRLEWREGRSPGDPGRLLARLDRLSLPPTEALELERLTDEGPSRLPSLDIVIDNFEIRGKSLGQIEVQANSAPAAGPRSAPREWRLDKLAMKMPRELELVGQGVWRAPTAPGAPRRMELDFSAELADSGKLTTRLGWADAIRGGKGRLTGRLAWDGSPLAPDAATMDGRLTVALERGQFLKAELGFGRLLGVLSLQSLPRRLLLDFRDVFQEGFAFDNAYADVTLHRGRANTDNLRMKGLQAQVRMAGTADLVRETQDLKVLVVPEVNAGAASLAYLAINPAVGLGTFLAQMLLRDPLSAAGTRGFHITGQWADPKVEPVADPRALVRDFDALAKAAAEAAPPAASGIPLLLREESNR